MPNRDRRARLPEIELTTQALIDRPQDGQVTELIDIARPSVV